MTPADHVNKANETLRFAQSLTAYLIAGAMSQYEPEQHEVQDLGFQLQNHLTAIDECLKGLWQAAKDKPEPPKERVTTPESDDITKLLRIHDEIKKISDQELFNSLQQAWVKIAKPFVGKEWGFWPEADKPTETTEGEQ